MKGQRFRDRTEAGQLLATQLAAYAHRPDVLVLALPRGGVPVAFEVARALHAPLDVLIVRKLGVPGEEELAMGAIASGGVCVLNNDVVQMLAIPDEVINKMRHASNTKWSGANASTEETAPPMTSTGVPSSSLMMGLPLGPPCGQRSPR